jgi:hypothetical protein
LHIEFEIDKGVVLAKLQLVMGVPRERREQCGAPAFPDVQPVKFFAFWVFFLVIYFDF